MSILPGLSVHESQPSITAETRGQELLLGKPQHSRAKEKPWQVDCSADRSGQAGTLRHSCWEEDPGEGVLWLGNFTFVNLHSVRIIWKLAKMNCTRSSVIQSLPWLQGLDLSQGSAGSHMPVSSQAWPVAVTL